jgi:hypothetical protein
VVGDGEVVGRGCLDGDGVPCSKGPPGRFSAVVAFSAGGVDQDGEMDSSQLILFQRLRHGYEKGAARTAGSNDCGEVS